MPSFTLAFWENRVRADLAGHERSTVKKVAKLAKRRFDNYTHEPTDEEMLEFFSTITYTDPTPYQAIRNINAENAARRLGAAA
jgi:hypothetical protein